jgi:hypothetical protein
MVWKFHVMTWLHTPSMEMSHVPVEYIEDKSFPPGKNLTKPNRIARGFEFGPK